LRGCGSIWIRDVGTGGISISARRRSNANTPSAFRDPSLVDPDNWVIDAALIARPGMDEISLDLLYDIRKNIPVFAAARQYFRDQQVLIGLACVGR
jgi:hypothetical protein